MDRGTNAGGTGFVPRASDLLPLLGKANFGLISLDSDGRVLYINATAAQLVGRKPESLTGDYLGDLVPRTKDDELQLSLMPEFNSPEVRAVAYDSMFGDGFDVYAQETEGGGNLLLLRDKWVGPQLTALVSQLADALTAAEERLADSERAAAIGSWERNLVSGERSWSQETYRLLDFDRTKPEPGSDEIKAKFADDDFLWIDLACKQAVASGESFARDLRLSLGGIGTRWVHIRGRAVADRDGNRTRLVGTLQDITARKMIETEKDTFLQTAIQTADHDPLTGLLNHRAFHHYLRSGSQRLDRVRRSSPVSDLPSLAVIVLDMDNFKYFNDTYGHLSGDQILVEVAAAIQACCNDGDMPARVGGDEFAICLPKITREEYRSFLLSLRLALDAICFRPLGKDIAIPMRVSFGAALFPEEAPTSDDALYLADKRAILDKGGAHDSDAERLRATLSQEMDGFSMLDALVAAVDNKDRYTRRHSEEVMLYCAAIADHLGLEETEKSSLQTAALVHDVGKIGVPNPVLRLPNKLNAAQFDAVKRHPTLGGILVSAVPELKHTLPAVRHHHERWDGRGYPAGLSGENIPLSARIMAVADAFSAMTNNRPYRKGMPEDDAQRILREGSGTQWDPNCVEAFLASRASESLPASPPLTQQVVEVLVPR